MVDIGGQLDSEMDAAWGYAYPQCLTKGVKDVDSKQDLT